MKGRRIIDYINKAWFHLKWLTMSERDRYAYLWNRTRASMYECRLVPSH